MARAASGPVRRVRVGLVDDHELVGIALRAVLAPYPRLAFAGGSTSVDGLLAVEPSPDLAVLDLRLPDGTSPGSNIDRLREAGARVVVFTSGESPFLLRLAAQADVLGIVQKSDPLEVLVRVLEQAAAGRPVPEAIWASTVAADPSLAGARLSRQETRILSMFADGDRSATVAAALEITVGTLEDYVRRIRVKYARAGRPAGTKVDLYKRAVEDGFLPIPARAAAGGDD